MMSSFAAASSSSSSSMSNIYERKTRSSSKVLSQTRANINRRMRDRVNYDDQPVKCTQCDKVCTNEQARKKHQIHCTAIAASSSPPPSPHYDDDDQFSGGGDHSPASPASPLRAISPLPSPPSPPLPPLPHILAPLLMRPPSPPLRPPSPPRPARIIVAKERLPSILEYINIHLVALQGRHSLPTTVMNDLLALHTQVVPMLLIAGIGAKMRVLNPDGKTFTCYSGPAPLPAIHRMNVPQPHQSMLKHVRSNAAGPPPFTIHTLTNSGVHEELPNKKERKPTPSTIYQPKNQRKSIVDVAKLVDVNRDEFTEKLLCPDPECGAEYDRVDAERIRTCTRYRAIHLEQPIGRIDICVKKLEKWHQSHRDTCHALHVLNIGENYIPAVMEHYRQRCCTDAKCKDKYQCIITPMRSECKQLISVTGECKHMLSHKHKPDCVQAHKIFQTCGEQLFDSRNNQPRLPYPYLGVKGPLMKMLMRDGFEPKCKLWQNRYNMVTKRRLQSKILADIYDGQFWQDYMFIHRETKKPITDADIAYHRRVWEAKKDGPIPDRPANGGDIYHHTTSIPLLARDGTLALAINVDWYQPFEGMNFSMGAIYLTVLNLPREERYLTENMILVGVLPGPKQTSREQLQGALRPLMKELNELFGDGHGVQLPTYNSPAGTNVTAFLQSVICDSPAARHMGGNMNHSGNVGCPYCTAGGTGGSGGSFTNCSGTGPHHGKRQKGSHWGPASIGHKEQWDAPEYRRTDATNRRAALEWSTAKYVGTVLSCGRVPIAAVGGEVLKPVKRIKIDRRQNEDDDADEALDDNDHGDAIADNGGAEEVEDGRFEDNEDDMKEDEFRFDLETLCPQLSNQEAAGRKRFASLRGQRYCALMDLPYFDTRRGIPIDVMHNIFLGLCKEMMSLLSKHDEKKNPNPIISKAHLEELQSFMERCECPSDIGAIPGKIASSMAKFKAVEYMNWMTIFCVPAMRHLFMTNKPKHLTELHIELLSHMQRLAKMMQANVITTNEVVEIDQLLVQVIDRVEYLWPSGTKVEKLEIVASRALDASNVAAANQKKAEKDARIVADEIAAKVAARKKPSKSERNNDIAWKQYVKKTTVVATAALAASNAAAAALDKGRNVEAAAVLIVANKANAEFAIAAQKLIELEASVLKCEIAVAEAEQFVADAAAKAAAARVAAHAARGHIAPAAYRKMMEAAFEAEQVANHAVSDAEEKRKVADKASAALAVVSASSKRRIRDDGAEIIDESSNVEAAASSSSSKKRKNVEAAASSSSSSSSKKRKNRTSLSSSLMRHVTEHVKPNLHYAQHLAEQILDYGPPVNWWCNSYERFNGLLAGVPYTPSYIEVCTMRRHLLMREIAQRASEKISTANRIVDAAPFTPGDDHYKVIAKMVSGVSADVVVHPTGEWTKVRTTASNRKVVEYAFGEGMNRIDNYLRFVQQRQCLLPGQYVDSPPPLATPFALPIGEIRYSFIEVRGDERYPGILMGDGQHHNLHSLSFNDSPVGLVGTNSRAATGSRVAQQPAAPYATKKIDAGIVYDCLMIHYSTVYDITKQHAALAVVAGAVADDGGVAPMDVDDDPVPVIAVPIVAAPGPIDDWYPPRADLAGFRYEDDSYWDTARKDGVQRTAEKLEYLMDYFSYVITPTIRVHTSMMMAGETYGSVLANIHSTNSYVVINCRVHMEKHKKLKYGAEPRRNWPSETGMISEASYARIQYFIRHLFMNRYHDFAVVRWHGIALEAEAATLFEFPIALESTYNVDDEERFRWVNAQTLDLSGYMVIPVQRILHRWIPHVMPPKVSALPHLWQVCPMQTKVHV